MNEYRTSSGPARIRRTSAALIVRITCGIICGIICFAAAPRAQAAGPCCSVTSVDMRTGIVAARENATGRTFTFKATRAALTSLKAGQAVYANFGAKQVSFNGATPCCVILSVTAAPVAAVQTAANPNLVAASAAAATAQLTKGTGGQAPAAVSSTITQLTAPNYVTALSATGTYFVFVSNGPRSSFLAAPPPPMIVGEKVSANLSTKEVWLGGSSQPIAMQWICPGPPANQPCPAGAASCQEALQSSNAGCPVWPYRTSTPVSCQNGYYGLECQPCSSKCPNTCNIGNGLCP